MLIKCEIDLTEHEKFILFACAWTHDIGMIEEVALEYLGDEYCIEKRRDEHDEISAAFIHSDDGFVDIFKKNDISEGLFQSYVNTINIISKLEFRVSGAKRPNNFQ